MKLKDLLISIKNTIKKPRYFIPAVIVIAILFFIFSGEKIAPEIFTVKNGRLVQSVNLSGHVRGATDLKLSFERTGQLAQLYVKTGQKVYRGQLLASLKSADYAAQLRQSQASLAQAKAIYKNTLSVLVLQKSKLAELKGSARNEELASAQADLFKAQQDLTTAYQNSLALYNNSFALTDDVIHRQLDPLFINDDTFFPRLNYLTSNSQAQTDSEAERVKTTQTFTQWQKNLTALSLAPTEAEIETALQQTLDSLQIIRNLFLPLSQTLTEGTGLAETTITSYKTALSTARSQINTSLTAILNQLQTINAQKSTIQKYQNTLDLKIKIGSNQQISQQEENVSQAEANVEAQAAAVKQAEANLALASANLEKNYLRAPVAGTVVKITPQIGTLILANTAVMSLVSLNQMEIEVNISEIDVGKIKIGNPVKIGLDAYPTENFSGSVIAVDPGETVTDGIVNYRATITFDKANDRLKSGLTADVTIETFNKDNVLILPRYALIQRDNKFYVKRALTEEEVEIQVGLRGQDNAVEIISGLKAGDQILSAGPKNN